MPETEYRKPIPVPSSLSEPFWEACKRHELIVQKCKQCASHRFPPAFLCPECMSEEVEWSRVSGRGTVFSFVVYRRLYNAAFEGDLPYTVAIVELAEGVRMLSNIVGVAPEDVRCEMEVAVVFEDITPDATLPKFRPI